MNIAKVIVSKNAKELDKIFHYIIPSEFDIAVGCRVLVPFGNANRSVSGIVVGFTETTEQDKLKSIISVLDSKPVLTPHLIKLASLMREKYLCTYNQALKTIIPAGFDVKTTIWITLTDKNVDLNKICGRSEVKRKILERLKDGGGTIDLGSVSDISSFQNGINSLKAQGIITLDETIAQNVKSKQIRMATLSVSYSDAAELINQIYKKAPKQAKLLEILRQTGDIALSDLISFSNSTYSAANSLYKKGIINYYNKVILRNAYNINKYTKTKQNLPTAEQSEILKCLKEKYDSGNFKPSLIRGVTGSGKTEVFLQIIDHVLKDGRQAIVLVPEISLTPQTVKRFVERFGSSVSVLHSSLSLGERYDEWNKIRRGDVNVVIGARSAVFAPFENLGIIIVDEEHETTYKSEMSPFYNAKGVALWRANLENAMVIFGSATPSIDSFYKAINGQYDLFEMKERYNFAKMPSVDIVDMRRELESGNKSVFSKKLLFEIKENIKNKQQTILFLNRRGFNSFVMCRNCGEVVICKNCNISMTYHKSTGQLKCHYCGFERETITKCPSCDSSHIRFMGSGTEKIEEELLKEFGEGTFIRMDSDTTSGKNSHEAILNRFEREKIPILLGTQMVTKGLDFPNVTLVGVLAADLSLNIDDFRAAERTFSQLTQVCGRAGRGELPGRAVIQTYQPDHYAITLAKDHNYIKFYENEITIRKQLSCPPFCDMILIMSQGLIEKKVASELKVLAEALRKRGLFVLGPTPAPYSKIKNKYRWRIIIKHKNSDELLPLLTAVMNKYRKSENSISIDINPNSMN